MASKALDIVTIPAAETHQSLTDCRALLADDHFVYIFSDHGGRWMAKDFIFIGGRTAESDAS